MTDAEPSSVQELMRYLDIRFPCTGSPAEDDDSHDPLWGSCQCGAANQRYASERR